MDLAQLAEWIDADEKRRQSRELVFQEWYERKVSRRLSGEDEDCELRNALRTICRSAFLAGIDAQ